MAGWPPVLEGADMASLVVGGCLGLGCRAILLQRVNELESRKRPSRLRALRGASVDRA
jgi:uncharacterized protein (DUF2062 family)